MTTKRYLGEGKARDFEKTLLPGEICMEEGRSVYAVVEAEFFCDVCDGCGCRECKFTGEMEERNKRRAKKRRSG